MSLYIQLLQILKCRGGCSADTGSDDISEVEEVEMRTCMGGRRNVGLLCERD